MENPSVLTLTKMGSDDEFCEIVKRKVFYTEESSIDLRNINAKFEIDCVKLMKDYKCKRFTTYNIEDPMINTVFSTTKSSDTDEDDTKTDFVNIDISDTKTTVFEIYFFMILKMEDGSYQMYAFSSDGDVYSVDRRNASVGLYLKNDVIIYNGSRYGKYFEFT